MLKELMDMTLGEDILIFMVTLGAVWLVLAFFVKKLYGEKKVICATCNRKVRSLGTARCPKCGGVLYKDYYDDDYYKR
jgi:predicted amidophosphoribosyltransferase